MRMATLKRSLAAAFLFVAGPASAQSLSNGEPLQFNYEYHCSGERMIVGHCRDNDPSSYCMVYYPDRTPLHPGYQVQKAEQLGDVLARLSVCASSASAATSAQSRPWTTPVGKDAVVHGGSAAAKAPGLGKQPWQLLYINDDVAIFYTVAEIKRGGTSPDGWFTELFTDGQNLGPGATDVQFPQGRYQADCGAKGLKVLQFAAYDMHLKLLKNGSTSGSASKSPRPNSDQEQMLALLCGTKKMKMTNPFVRDGFGLFGLDIELQKIREKAQQAK